MIEIDGVRFPESQVASIRERNIRRLDKDGKAAGYDTTWTVEPQEGRAIESIAPPRWFQTIPNTTPLRILVVTDLEDDSTGDRFHVAERPIIAWRVDSLADCYDAYSAGTPLMADSIASNQRWCLFDPLTGQAWEQCGFVADTREEAVRIMREELQTRVVSGRPINAEAKP
jgi:hypothetical protein